MYCSAYLDRCSKVLQSQWHSCRYCWLRKHHLHMVDYNGLHEKYRIITKCTTKLVSRVSFTYLAQRKQSVVHDPDWL